MINDVFYNPTKIIFGKGTEKQVGLESSKHTKKLLVHYGSDRIKKNGLFKTVMDSLKAANVDFEELGGVQPNPRQDLVYEGIELCKKDNIDFVLAVGSGSVIDSAKAISMGAMYEGDFMDFYRQIAKPAACLKIGTVLTLPGAGSESSGSSVITDTRAGLKRPCDSELLRPVFSILNPELTYTVPIYHTLAGAFDAMVHALERYFTNTRYVDVTDRMAEGVMRSIMKYMALVVKQPDNYDVRAEIMWACKIAHDGTLGVGRVQSWECHLLQRDIGSILTDSSHGAGLAVIVPAWMRYACKHDAARFAQWANRVMDVQINTYDIEATAMEGIDRLAAFIKRLGLPTKLSELGVKGDGDLRRISQKAFPNGDERLGGYTGMTKQDFINILASVLQ